MSKGSTLRMVHQQQQQQQQQLENKEQQHATNSAWQVSVTAVTRLWQYVATEVALNTTYATTATGSTTWACCCELLKCRSMSSTTHIPPHAPHRRLAPAANAIITKGHFLTWWSLQTTNNNKQSTSFQAVLSRVIGLINIATKRVVRITTLPPSAAAIDGINS
ncbi:unnamed protein product [Ceratitis capitata]|uniref:(Mediterranean fruit fly) hypothetical protein n=1 Tax=Ceratitis capitata TaxID=7213 RepID=A0A811U397_CERCA|nr:unnamed protein product [Ceratitis capitata]